MGIWELVIAIGISIPNSPNIKIEQMPSKDICFEVLKSIRFQTEYPQQLDGLTFAYCRPISVKEK